MGPSTDGLATHAAQIYSSSTPSSDDHRGAKEFLDKFTNLPMSWIDAAALHSTESFTCVNAHAKASVSSGAAA